MSEEITNIHEAVSSGTLDDVKRFIAEINSKEPEFGRTPLIIACSGSDNETLNFLLSNGADTNAQDNEGETALMIVCQRDIEDDEKVALIRLLLSHKSDVNIQNDLGYAALHFAVWYGPLKIVNILAPLTKSIDLKTASGATVLIKVCESSHSVNQGKTDILEYILNEKASIDAQDNFGATALMNSVSWSRPEKVEMLLKRGANRDLKSNEGLSAIDYADDLEDADVKNKIIELLKN